MGGLVPAGVPLPGGSKTGGAYSPAPCDTTRASSLFCFLASARFTFPEIGEVH